MEMYKMRSNLKNILRNTYEAHTDELQLWILGESRKGI
jgi:hypothetical protein